MAKKTTLRTPKINEQGEKEYEYIYPQTRADIVHLEDGTSVEEKIIELEENSGVTTDNTTPYQVVDDYNPAHKKYVDTSISQAITEALEDKVTQEYVDTSISQAITEALEDKVTQEYVDTAIQLAITGVLEGEV